MSQNLNLSFSGLYTSQSDFNGIPPGAMTQANNVEARYKNLAEPRRGFDELLNSEIIGETFTRLTNFDVAGSGTTVMVTSLGNWRYYTGASPSPLIPGDYSTGIENPDDIFSKSRFTRAGQNLYVTTKDGVRSLSSGASGQTLPAGCPAGLNIQAVTNGDISGFFNNNISVTTTGNISATGVFITNLDTTTGITVGQYVTGIEVAAKKIVQDLTYTSVLFGVLGNAITIAYTGGGTAGAEVVTVVGTAISVKIQNSVSTATQIRTAINASAAALALVSVVVSGTGATAQVTAGAAALTGGLDNTIPVGTKVASITSSSTVIIQTGTTTAGSTTISALVSSAGIVAGLLVSGTGVPEGATVVSISGGGPYSVVISSSCFKTGTSVDITFTSPVIVSMDHDALSTLTNTPISFYAGAQVAYVILYGRVETDIDGGTITRLGAQSPVAIAYNTSPYTTNVTVTATLPKNSENVITFVQLYRSAQTDSISISPIAQYQLVHEAALTHSDFVARTITITDSTDASLRGAALYSGTDREGILQSNDQPPLCWDMTPFRDFMVYVNTTQPSTLSFTVVGVGGTSGVQVGDTITISGTLLGTAYSETYTAAVAENAAARQFVIVTSGTDSQNITDTTNSLIRVINYDNALPVHAILISTATDLPGQILLQADQPTAETFTITASAHQSAYDPTLSAVISSVNTNPNGIVVSKSGELEAAPQTNIYFAGDSSGKILRAIALRDYVIILKDDGVYKLQGTSPSTLVCNPFDLTTQILGSETAVRLNSSVWMLSNQGVVSISDSGVDAKSVPIDDQINRLIDTYLDSVDNAAFGVGYESDRKYILSVASAGGTTTDLQYIYNYVTNCWTTWDRRLRTAYIHSNDEELYIARSDTDNTGISKERKSGDYTDFVDEFITGITIGAVSVSGLNLTLSSLDGVEVGDIVIQGINFSPILSINVSTLVVTVESDLGWTTGAISIGTAYECFLKWKQVFADNPAFVRQYQEGICLFKNTKFNTALLDFETDYSNSSQEVPILGNSTGLWGLFPWGEVPWGGDNIPKAVRFYVPSEKQMGSYLIPMLTIKQAYSDFKFQGLAIAYENVSIEVGI